MTRSLSRVAFVLATLAAPAVVAQTTPTLIQRLPILDSRRIEAIERGEAVAITLDAPEKTEIATLGVVRIEVPRAFYLERVKSHTGFFASGATPLQGSFSDPPRPEDVAALVLDPSDAKVLEKCEPFACDLKLPASEMLRFREQLAKAPNPSPRADSMMRTWLLAYVAAYRADSLEETVVYDDTKHSVRSSDAFRALLTEPLIAGIDAAPFASMLATPRSARPPEVASRISWEVNRMPGLKPTLEVLERSIYSSPTHPEESWLTSKLLYASHYFESQIDFITVADAPPAPGAMYLVIIRRSKFDDLPSGGLFNIRGKAVKRLRDALKSTLASTRLELQNAYGGAAAPGSHAP